MSNAPMNFMRTEHVDAGVKLNEEVAIFTHLDHHLEQARRAEEALRYVDRPKSLGAGRVGHPLAPSPWDRGCERALWFEFKQYASDRPFPAKLYRIFDMGHAAETIMADNLRKAGFTLLTEGEDGKQFGFELARDPETGHARFKGFCDGVVVDGPASLGGEKDGIKLKYPFLWENKAINDKKFSKFAAEGLERSHPQYYAQMQVYMNFLQLYENPGLITVVNRDTGEVRIELIRYNQRHCQAIIDRASRIVNATGPLTLERAADDYDKIPCKWCDFKSHCQAAELNRPTVEDSRAVQAAPNWLSKQG